MSEEKSKSENLQEVQEQLRTLKAEVDIIKRHPSPVQYVNQQDKLLEGLIENGVTVFEKWLDANQEIEKLATEKQLAYEQEELKALQLFDRRDKYYKGIIVGICIISLGVLAYFGKAESVAPVIGVVIGLVLKTNSISEYFGSSKKSTNEPEG